MTIDNWMLQYRELQKQGKAEQAYIELQEILKRNKEQKPKFNLLKSIPSGMKDWLLYSISAYFIVAIGWGIDTKLISIALMIGFVCLY